MGKFGDKTYKNDKIIVNYLSSLTSNKDDFFDNIEYIRPILNDIFEIISTRNLELLKNILFSLRKIKDFKSRCVIYYYLIKRLKDDKLKQCINEIINENRLDTLFFFILDYLKFDKNELPRFAQYFEETKSLKRKVLDIVQNGDEDELYVIIMLGLINKSLELKEIQELIENRDSNFLEKFILVQDINRIDAWDFMYSNTLESLDDEKEEDFYDYIDTDESRNVNLWGKEELKNYLEDFNSFIYKHFKLQVRHYILDLLTDGKEEMLTKLIRNALLEYIPPEELIRVLHNKIILLEKMYIIFRKLEREECFDTFAREDFYDRVGDYFENLTNYFTPVLKKELVKILENGGKDDKRIFNNLGWLEYIYGKGKGFDPSKYKRIDEF